MSKDLTNSQIDRQNVLNNEQAIVELQKSLEIEYIFFEDKLFFTKEMLAKFFDVDVRTIERYISAYSDELKENGYEILSGKRLREFIASIASQDVTDTNVGNISKAPKLGIFDFRAFLNIGMLLVESENARILRKAMLDVVIDLINQKTGGSTKYINQRDKDFIGSYLQEDNYRKEFTDALRDYVDMGNFKYALFTDMIYQSIFKEKAQEYKVILRLHKNDKVRDTLYAEILDLVASYEYGLAETMRERSKLVNRKLTNWEALDLFKEFENLPHWKPLIARGREKMASRDFALRDVFHKPLEEYIRSLDSSEYERFLGLESDEIAKLMEANADVLKRLKERE